MTPYRSLAFLVRVGVAERLPTRRVAVRLLVRVRLFVTLRLTL